MNKLAIVTGATSGYGLATAIEFQKQGYDVIAVSRNKEKVEATVKEYGFTDGYTLDVTDYDGWVKFRDYVKEKYGKANVLVNNAGGGVAIKSILEQTIEEIESSLSLNLHSAIYGSKVFADIFCQQKSGTIINVASVCATHCWPNWSIYGAAKAGMLNFTKGLYMDLQPYGVRATCLIPASAETEFAKNANLVPQSHSLKVEDIAKTIVFIANLPDGAVVEEMTVWGISQVVDQL